MSTWFNQAVRASGTVARSIGHLRGTIIVAAGLGLGSFLTVAPTVAAADEQPATKTAEDSVLVATRESATSHTPSAASPATNDDGESLEPISEVAEHTPELATASNETAGDESASNENNDAGEFGAALAKIADGKEDKTLPAKRSVASAPVSVSVPYEPATFHGIEVGKSTKIALIESWGKPADSIDTEDGAVLTYDMEPFQAVEVLVAGDTISAIKIALAANLEPKQLAKQLSLDEIEPVTVTDEAGQALGLAFPERGVLFMFTVTEEEAAKAKEAKASDDEAAATVSHVAIQPLDARAFALRAENHLHGPYQQNVRDLKTALALEPELAHAQWLLAEIYLATGQADQAESAAAAACELEPKDGTFQVCHARTLTLLGQYDDAVHEIRTVLDREDLPPLVRAQALYEMARLASLGDVQIAAKAIPFHTKAIELADKLATSENVKERHAAKKLLIDAHLAIGEEIARQSFNNKVEALSLWIGRASGLAEDFITTDGGSAELRLKVAQSALASLASFKPTLSPAPWVAEAEEASKLMFAQSDDKLWQQHVQWELGIAYFQALRVDHLRQQTNSAIHYGQEAISNLAEAASSRQAVHSSEQMVGALYFYMGAVYAVHDQDHTKAIVWYDKAVPLLTGPRPVSELYSPRREGEVLVSMGVTYWQQGQQARALEITQSGANLIELAVEDGILAKTSLSVPYGNLAAMYEQMGEATNATKYAEMANAASPKAEPRTGRATPASMRTGAVPQSNNMSNTSNMPRPNTQQQQQRQRMMNGTRR